VVISKEVVDGDAKPLLIYADRDKQGNAKMAPVSA
jgi:ATP-dependent Clp protease ATP-binding subunit ClpX